MITNSKIIKVEHNSSASLPQTIGIFDSGVGGLSIAKCIQQHLPHEQLVYIADSAHAPYGDKSAAFIRQRVNIIARQLLQYNAKALVVACNTATVNAIDQLRAQLSLPIIGVEPAIKPAALHSKSKKVAILVTAATATNQRFLDLVAKYSSGIKVFIQACPGLVELIEQGKNNSGESSRLLKEYLQPLMQQGVDTLVLGCTHYPFLLNEIKNIVGEAITIVETATPVTQELTRQLAKHQINAPLSQSGKARFFSSLYNDHQQKLITDLWQKTIFLENLTI